MWVTSLKVTVVPEGTNPAAHAGDTMGLHVHLYVQCDQIDPERWEAIYLTSLQLGGESANSRSWIREWPDLWPIFSEAFADGAG